MSAPKMLPYGVFVRRVGHEVWHCVGRHNVAETAAKHARKVAATHKRQGNDVEIVVTEVES